MLLDSHSDIEAERSNVQYSNNPMAVLVHRNRRSESLNLAVQDEERQDEAEGLLVSKEEDFQDDLSMPR